MPIPVITDHFQVQWIWQGASGLPTDVFVTTWYFRNDNVGGDTPASMVEAVAFFWSQTATGALGPIQTYMPDTLVSARAKVYDLGQQAPRYPVHDEIVPGAVGGSAAQPFPREVAVVQSYYSGHGPRKRGRNYIGPLTVAAIDVAADGIPRVRDQFRTDLAAAALDLRDSSLPLTWVQCSTTYGETGEVLGGWIDDAFDTQRSRGKDPSTRTTWGLPPG